MIRLWENAWAEFVPFLDHSLEIRKIICSTNAVESLHDGCAGPPWLEATSPPNRQRSNASTW